jgi:hypothetical protein
MDNNQIPLSNEEPIISQDLETHRFHKTTIILAVFGVLMFAIVILQFYLLNKRETTDLNPSNEGNNELRHSTVTPQLLENSFGEITSSPENHIPLQSDKVDNSIIEIVRNKFGQIAKGFSISPDKKKLAFYLERVDENNISSEQLQIYDLESGKIIRSYSDTTGYSEAHWLSDSRHLIIYVVAESMSIFNIIDITSDNITTQKIVMADPVWTNNDYLIAFISSDKISKYSLPDFKEEVIEKEIPLIEYYNINPPKLTDNSFEFQKDEYRSKTDSENRNAVTSFWRINLNTMKKTQIDKPTYIKN